MAVRMVGMGPQAAGARLALSGADLRALETLLKKVDFSHLRGRQQFSANSLNAGATNEIEYLLSDAGNSLTTQAR